MTTSISGKSGWVVFAVVAILAAIADLGTKWYVFDRLGMPGEKRPIDLIPNMLWLETNLNEGALFGIGQGFGMVFAVVSCVAIVGILFMVAQASTRRQHWILIAFALVSGGIVGNLYDRLGFPGLRWNAPDERMGRPVLAVRDWIHFRLEGVIDWPIFNLADSWLVIGAGILLLLSVVSRPALDRDKKKANTIASAIEINRPVNLTKCLRALEECDGVVREVSEQEILDAKAQVGAGGLGCEPASAASVAGAKQLVAEGVIDRDQRVVCVLTGHQLKDPTATVAYHTTDQSLFNDVLGSRGVSRASFANRAITVGNRIEEIIQAIDLYALG